MAASSFDIAFSCAHQEHQNPYCLILAICMAMLVSWCQNMSLCTYQFVEQY